MLPLPSNPANTKSAVICIRIRTKKVKLMYSWYNYSLCYNCTMWQSICSHFIQGDMWKYMDSWEKRWGGGMGYTNKRKALRLSEELVRNNMVARNCLSFCASGSLFPASKAGKGFAQINIYTRTCTCKNHVFSQYQYKVQKLVSVFYLYLSSSQLDVTTTTVISPLTDTHSRPSGCFLGNICFLFVHWKVRKE